jgi:hypothetical protein
MRIGVVVAVVAALAGCKSADAETCAWTPSAEDIYEWRLDLVEGEGSACKGRIYFSNYWQSETIVPGWCEPVSVDGCDARFVCRHQDSDGVSRDATIDLTVTSEVDGFAEVSHDGVCVGEYELAVRRLDDFEP